jgi:acyl transferase domain-containing protein
MDVHHKLALLTATEALENAGIDFATLRGTDTGVFAGVCVFACARAHLCVRACLRAACGVRVCLRLLLFVSYCRNLIVNTAGGQVGGSVQFHPTFGWDEYSATGTALTMTSNRISFFFNLTGPSVTYDTACSGLMTALHGAHASLTQRECKLAILVTAVVHYAHAHNPSFTQLGVLSPDGRSRSFDDSANGCIF